MQRTTRRAETIPVYNDDTAQRRIDARRHTTTLDQRPRRHAMTNDNGWWRWWLLSATRSYYCNFVNPGLRTEVYFANLLCQRPKLIHGCALLIGPEARLSTMGKRWMSFASTSVLYPLPHLQICTSTFYHHPFGRCFLLFLVIWRKWSLVVLAH